MRRGYLKLAAAAKRRMLVIALALALILVGHLAFFLGAIAGSAFCLWRSRSDGAAPAAESPNDVAGKKKKEITLCCNLPEKRLYLYVCMGRGDILPTVARETARGTVSA
jgi:hypothetical protein